MTRDDDFIRLLEGYLDEYEGSTPMPASVRDAVRARLPSTMQRPAWWPERRFPTMNNYLRIGLAAAVVAVAAAVGYNYLVAPNVGGPELFPAEPTPTPTPAPDLNAQEGPLTAGSYSISVSGHLVTFSVPAGWTKNVADSVVWTGNSEARVSFGDIDRLSTDPCRRELGLIEVGPTVDDLATALAAMPGVETTTAGVTLSGFAGTRVEMTVTETPADCSEGEALLDGEAPLEPGLHTFWILDVDGDRIVIGSVARTAASNRDRTQLGEIVASVQID